MQSVPKCPTDTHHGAFPMTSLNNSPNTAPPTSSPPLLSSPMVSTKKRVTRTYGSKRVEAPPSDEPLDADRSFSTLVEDEIPTSLSPVARSHRIDDNAVSSQDTKVDDDDEEEKDNFAGPPEYQWAWREALKKLDKPEDEMELTSALSVPRRSADAYASPSPPISPGRGAKSKGKRPSTSPKKPRSFPPPTVRSDSGLSARVSAEPEASGSDGERSPSPFPSKQKRRASARITDQPIVEDSESDAPRASSSKPRGGGFNLGDAGTNDRTSPGSVKRKRKATTGRKPTAKVKCHDIHSIRSN